MALSSIPSDNQDTSSISSGSAAESGLNISNSSAPTSQQPTEAAAATKIPTNTVGHASYESLDAIAPCPQIRQPNSHVPVHANRLPTNQQPAEPAPASDQPMNIEKNPLCIGFYGPLPSRPPPYSPSNSDPFSESEYEGSIIRSSSGPPRSKSWAGRSGRSFAKSINSRFKHSRFSRFFGGCRDYWESVTKKKREDDDDDDRTPPPGEPEGGVTGPPGARCFEKKRQHCARKYGIPPGHRRGGGGCDHVFDDFTSYELHLTPSGSCPDTKEKRSDPFRHVHEWLRRIRYSDTIETLESSLRSGAADPAAARTNFMSTVNMFRENLVPDGPVHEWCSWDEWYAWCEARGLRWEFGRSVGRRFRDVDWTADGSGAKTEIEYAVSPKTIKTCGILVSAAAELTDEEVFKRLFQHYGKRKRSRVDSRLKGRNGL